MTTTTATGTPTVARKPRKPAPRKAVYHRVNARFGTLELTIGEGEKAETFGYYVEPIPSDYGRAFRLTKYRCQQRPGEADAYAVLLDVSPEDPQRVRHSCECLGFIRWGRCKHVSALLALHQAGRLDATDEPATTSPAE